MAWRDDLRKGSFRGVPFHWQSSDTDLGRRKARHDYPFRDDPAFEDMGKAPREFTLEMYVVGPDYMPARDRLAEAFEEPGPGTLVHPTWGTLKVELLGKAKCRETTQEGGMARFTATFVIATGNRYPTAAVDTAGAVVQAAASVKQGAAAAAERKITAGKAPGVVDALNAIGGNAVSRVMGLRSQIAIPSGLAAAAAAFITQGAALRTGIIALVRAPALLVQGIQGIIESVSGLFSNPRGSFDIYRDLFDFGNDAPAIARTTPGRAAQADNQDAVVTLVRTTAVAAAAGQAALIEFPNYPDALRVRDSLLEALDGLLDTADDDMYLRLSALRSAVVADIATRGADLARIVTYTPDETLPALVIAHRLYGDSARADEILSRNHIRHPGFVTGGQSLEVLTDA